MSLSRLFFFLWFILLTACESLKTSPPPPFSPAEEKTLRTMTQEVVHQMNRYTKIGTKKWDYKTAVTDMPVQVGSLTKLMMQLKGDRYAHEMTEKEIKAKMADELTDILSLVLFIAHELSIDIHQAWAAMLASDDHKIDHRTQRKNHE